MLRWGGRARDFWTCLDSQGGTGQDHVHQYGSELQMRLMKGSCIITLWDLMMLFDTKGAHHVRLAVLDIFPHLRHIIVHSTVTPISRSYFFHGASLISLK
jgi:hypothetical protein